MHRTYLLFTQLYRLYVSLLSLAMVVYVLASVKIWQSIFFGDVPQFNSQYSIQCLDKSEGLTF